MKTVKVGPYHIIKRDVNSHTGGLASEMLSKSNYGYLNPQQIDRLAKAYSSGSGMPEEFARAFIKAMSNNEKPKATDRSLQAGYNAWYGDMEKPGYWSE